MYDVIFKNGNVVDVKNEQILQADIAVKDGKIAGIGHFSGENVIDCTGKYITPGFIDAHVHIESSMATPMEFSKAVMPHGTTTVIADPHELVNVKGNEAMEYILDAAGDAPLGIYVMMPSSIPATPFETNGADFTAEDMKQWKDHPLVLGLGEVMCYPAVLSKEEQIMKKLELCKGMVIDGHAPGLSGEDLKAYVEAGVMTDHECTSFEEAKEKCLAGMKILIREGSAARNVENIVPGLVKEPEFIAHFMFCTDDKHLDTIENEGNISYNIKKSIQLGMNPISAVKMATYNAAKTYGLNDIGVLEEGKDADIVILDSLESVEVHSVYKQGRIVNTEFFTKEAKPVNESMLHTVVLKDISKDKIQVEAEGKIPVIGMIPGQIVTKFLQEEVPSKEGLFTPDSEYSKLCVFERHRGTGNAAAAPIKGYGITNGAIATSVAHDSHNIIAAGDNDEDIIKAVQTIEEIQGGYALVSEGKVLGTLPLTVAGLLSQKPAKDIQKGIDELLQKAWKLGISRDIDPFITLSFMALPVIPSLRLTDLGLGQLCRAHVHLEFLLQAEQARRRKRRRINKGRVAALLIIILVIAAGIFFVTTRFGRTSYASVNKSMGEYMVKANDDLLGKGTGKELKKSLYVPRKIDKTKKLIAFTFDDGPLKGNTERVLAALEKNDARATFFMLGQNANYYPETVKKVLESGNEVSSHTWNHTYLPKLSAAQVREQEDKTANAIYKACGSKPVSVRPPYGAINENVKKGIDAPLILWSVDTLDWKTKNTDATVKTILKHAKDGDIVLMHDIHKPTVAAVEKVLPILKKKGYEVCTVSELLEAKGVKAGKGDKVFSATDIIRK